jgi:putative ABC transport system permease protein
MVGRLTRLWLRAVARLVPRASRADWLEEWEGELDAHARRAELRARIETEDGPRRRHAMAACAWGALPDALYLWTREAGMRGWGRELRVVVRGLLRRPGFTAVALITLALGIGANTALFTVVHAVLLRPLPYSEPERLVRLWGTQNGERKLGGSVSYPDVHTVGERTSAFSAWAAFDEWRPAVGGEDRSPEVVYGATVNAGFFDVLGVRPALGRLFTRDEEGEGRELRVVIGWGLWQRHFGGDRDFPGRTILVNGNAAEVIGVLPVDFETPRLEGGSWGAPEIWRTVATPPPFRSGRSWAGIGRLSEGVTLEAAQAQVEAATAALEREYPEDNRGWGIELLPIREQLLGDADRVLALLMGAVGLVLLIACANVASLLLVRAVERRRELDIRIALGASRTRLAGTSVLEALVLAGFGAALGLGLAWLGVGTVADRLSGVLPRIDGIRVSPAVAAFTAGVALLTALLFGAVPALDAWLRNARTSGSRVAASARGGSAGHESVRLRRALVAGEVAVSVVLLVGAGVLVRSVDALYRVDLGMEREGVLTVSLHSAAFIDRSSDEAAALYTDLMGRLRALPGVDAAGAINILPLSGGFSCDGVTRDELPPPNPGEGWCAEIRSILPETLMALGIPLVRGRTTGEDDHRTDAPKVALISEEMAESFWAGEDPLGKSITIHEASWEVVGVVGDMRHFGPAGVTRPQAYLPAHQDPWGGVSYGLNLVLRGSGDPHALAPAVRRAIEEVDPALGITSVASMDDLLGDSVADSNFRATLFGAFAVLAVLLAMVGMGGVVAYSVRQRTREIGVRLAMGAAPSRVSRMVLVEAARLGFAGALAGVVAALLASRALEGMVFGVSARDPWTIGVALVLVALMGTLVSLLPARRAARVDPLRALAGE